MLTGNPAMDAELEALDEGARKAGAYGGSRYELLKQAIIDRYRPLPATPEPANLDEWEPE